MVDETDKTLDQPGEPTPDGSISSTWLKPQHNADPQRLSDVLRDITRLVSDWVWEVSPTLKFTYMSPRIFETLGFHPAELRDTTLLDLGTPINQAGDPVSIDWHRPFRAQLFSARNKLNDERLIELSGVPVFDAMSGKFSGVRGTAIDITERRQIEQKLQKARDDAEKVNRQRSTFLHTLSDEIRAPLGVILQAAGQMEQAALSRHMSDIQGAGDRLEHLANEILYLAQLEAGQMEFTMEPVAPTAIVDECLHDVEPLAQERNVRILGVHQWDGSIAVDRHRFKQVLLNLITNGIKYNRVGGQLTIATLRG
nr:PAS domain S-box protein [Rhodospirillaceae bacterium]